MSVGIGAFGPGSTLTTFTGLADGTEVNGLTVNGILFNYSLGNGQVKIDVGPGTTNNIAPPNIVSVGNNTGVLSMTLPSFVDTVGYGYAELTQGAVTAATTISLFSGATPVGALSYNGVPDPLFTGGFAGIESTIPFNSGEGHVQQRGRPGLCARQHPHGHHHRPRPRAIDHAAARNRDHGARVPSSHSQGRLSFQPAGSPPEARSGRLGLRSRLTDRLAPRLPAEDSRGTRAGVSRSENYQTISEERSP